MSFNLSHFFFNPLRPEVEILWKNPTGQISQLKRGFGLNQSVGGWCHSSTANQYLLQNDE